MEPRQALDEFDRLVREADRLEEDIFTPLPDREAVHKAALMLVLQHPEMRSQFAAKFGKMLGKHDLELLEYCMHELRWADVRAQLEAVVRDADEAEDIRARDYFARAMSAFTDRWSGRGFFERYPE